MNVNALIVWAVLAAPVHAAEPIPLGEARGVFEEARTLCERDGGRLWGASLRSPIMLVDPRSPAVVANVRDAAGVLAARDGVFVGRLPDDQNAASTAIEWSGTRWTQMLWPLPEEAGKRAILISHELFHNLQPRVRICFTGHSDGKNTMTSVRPTCRQPEGNVRTRGCGSGPDQPPNRNPAATRRPSPASTE